MYTPSHFKEKDQKAIHKLVQENPFGMLLINGERVPEITHLPMQLKTSPSQDSIFGHLASANPQSSMIQDGKPALAVFSGIHSYVSPRWYVDENQVPTWNYQVVHGHGTLRRIVGESEIMQLLNELTVDHESEAEQPWKANWSNQKITRLLKAVVGFELKIEHWEGKSKIGQNRSPEDRNALKSHLESDDDLVRNKLAQAMKKLDQSKP